MQSILVLIFNIFDAVTNVIVGTFLLRKGVGSYHEAPID